MDFEDLKNRIVLRFIKKYDDFLINAERELKERIANGKYFTRFNMPEIRDNYNLSCLIDDCKERIKNGDKIKGPIVDYIKMLQKFTIDEKNPWENQCNCCNFYFPSELITNIECLYKPHKIYKTTEFNMCNFCRDIHLEPDMPKTEIESYKTKLSFRDGEYFLPLEDLYVEDCCNNFINRCDYELLPCDIRFCCDWDEEGDRKWKKLKN